MFHKLTTGSSQLALISKLGQLLLEAKRLSSTRHTVQPVHHELSDSDEAFAEELNKRVKAAFEIEPAEAPRTSS